MNNNQNSKQTNDKFNTVCNIHKRPPDPCKCQLEYQIVKLLHFFLNFYSENEVKNVRTSLKWKMLNKHCLFLNERTLFRIEPSQKKEIRFDFKLSEIVRM